MKRLKKLLVTLALALAVGGLGSMAVSVPANASTWYKGLPKILKQHHLWEGQKKSRFGSAKQLYSRNYIETGKLKGYGSYFADVMRSYYKNGKYEDTFDERLINESRFENSPATAYTKMSKHTYQIKSTLKRSGYSDQRYKVKQSGKYITVWTKRLWNHIDPNKGLNRSQKKWHKIDKYKAIKTVSDNSLWDRDPLHK